MNPEQISNPIEAKDVELHERILKERLIEIQVIFADQKFYQLAKENPAIKFSEILEQHTSISGELKEAFKNYKQPSREEECVNYLTEVYRNIDEVYQSASKNNPELVFQYIVDELKRLEFSAPAEVKQRRKERMAAWEKERKQAGVLHYEIVSGKKDGIKSDILGPVIDIHVEELYKKGNESLGSQAVTDSFRKVALDILEKYPQITTITGRSWLMSHPLAKRLGFEIIEQDKLEVALQHSSTWLQFIDREGQINSKKLEQFMKTGEIPLIPSIGQMQVEKFLGLYLPPDKKGKIKLKKIDVECWKKIDASGETANRMRTEWDKLSESDLKDLVMGDEMFSEFFRVSKEGAEYLRLILEQKKKGLSLEQAAVILKEEQKKFQKLFEDFLYQKLWVEVETIIE